MPSISNIHIYTENPWLIVGTESNVLKSRPVGYVIGFATDTRKFFVFDIHEGWLSPGTAVAKHKILSEEHEDTKIIEPLEEGQILVVKKDPDDQDKLKWTALSRGQAGQILTSTDTSVVWSDPQASTHDLLDGDVHRDTRATTVQRGMLITGQDVSGETKWSGLSLGASGTFLKSDGVDAIWSVIDWDDVTNKPTTFPVTVRQNSGFDIGTRPRLNFIEGTNITMEISDDAVDNEIDITISATGGSSTHNLLQSDVHTDTNTASVSRGAVVVGQDFTGITLWSALVPTTSNTYLKYTGLDTIWDYISWNDIYDKPSEFPVSVYSNYSYIASRPGINFVAGSGINITAYDTSSVVDVLIESTATAGQHNLLSTTHDDTDPTTVSRGMIITGQDVDGFIKWAGLSLGTSGQVLKSDGTDVIWDEVDWSEVSNKPSAFPVTVRKNSGVNIGTRPRLNFIEGNNVTLTVTDDDVDNEIDITVNAAVSSHNLLQSDVHPDTVTTTVKRGMLIVGKVLSDGSGNIRWVGLEPGLNDQFLRVRRYHEGAPTADVEWSYIDWAVIWGKPYAFHVLVKKNSETLPSARAFDLNFIEGRNVSIDIVQVNDFGDDRADITISVNSIDWSEILNKPSSFPVSVRKNSGVNVWTRPRLNFIEGSNITLNITDDSINNEIDITISSSGGVSNHNLLQSSVHTDTNTTTVTRGMIITGQIISGVPRWSGLELGASGTVLKSDGTDAVWGNVAWGEITGRPSEFPVSTYRNGTLVGTRPRLNFIEGTGISISASDDSTNNRVNLTFAASHALLSAAHTDTNPTSVQRGMLITGQNIGGINRWSGLALGAAGQVVKSNGTDVVWGAVDWSEIANRPSSFPITVRRNSGANVGTRPRLNFIEGSNITLTVSDDAADNEIDITIAASGGVSTHNLLQSSVHTDTNTASVSRGATIVGRNFSGINRWDALAPTTANTFLKYNGTDTVWDYVTWGDINGKPTEFQVTIYRNSGLVGTRPRINFVEGSGISISASDDSANNRVNLTFSSAGHTLLGSTHSDTQATTVTRGMIITGRDVGGGVIRWAGLSLGAASSVLKSNGLDAVWSSLDWSEISGKPSSFPVTVQRNGGLVGNRPTLNFIEGTGISITASNDSAGNRINLTFESGPHQLLSSVHNDTNPTTVARGMLITGQNIGGINRWSGLTLGMSGQVVKSNGIDVVWGNVDWSEIAGRPSRFPITVQENGIAVSTRDTLNFRDGSQTNTSIDFTIQDDSTFNRTIVNAMLVGDIGTPTNADRWKLYGTNRGNPPTKGWYTRPWRHIGTRRYSTTQDGSGADTNEYKPEDVALGTAFNVTATGTPPSSVGEILDGGGSTQPFQCVLDVPGLWIVRLFYQHLGRMAASSAGTGNRIECLLQMMKREGTTDSTVPESPAIIRTNWVQFYGSGNMPTLSYGQSMVLLPIKVTYTGTSLDIRGNNVTGTVVYFKVSSNIVGSATSRLLDQYASTTSLNAYLVNPDS